jgi:hypothetical protein
VNVHSATTWPPCRQVTWADPEWYVPRTATDAVPPAFAVDRVVPAGVSATASPVSSREDRSSVPIASARPLRTVTRGVITAGVAGSCPGCGPAGTGLPTGYSTNLTTRDGQTLT